MPNCEFEQAAVDAANAALDAWADQGPDLVADAETAEQALTDCEEGGGEESRSASSKGVGSGEVFKADLERLLAKYVRKRR